jgi:Glycosyltransferase
MKIKTLYIGGFELPDKNAAAHRVMSNAKIIRELGGEVVFAGVDKDLSWGTPVLSTKKEDQDFVSYSIPYPKSKKQWIDYLCGIKPYVDVLEHEKNFTSVIFYNFPAIAMKCLMKYCRAHGIKCAADITEWYSARGKGLAFFVLKGIDTWLRMHVFHKQMDGLIVISKYLANYYKNHKNVMLIPPLVDLTEKKWANLPQKSDGEVINFVYAGSPGLKDRIDVLISALKLVKRPYHLDVVGLTQEEYLRRMPEDKDFLEHNESIVFKGRLSHVQTLEYVSAADYSCFFREDDRMTKAGFSTKFVEAISCGTPVLTNKTSNLEDFCHEGKNAILINTIAVYKIVDVIEKLQKRMKLQQTQFDYRSYVKEFQSFQDALQ